MAEQQCKVITGKPTDQRLALYKKLGDELILKKDTTGLLALVDHLVKKEGSEQYGRTYITTQALVYVAKQLLDEEAKNADPIKVEVMAPFVEKAVAVVREKENDFPDGLMQFISLLAQCYQAQEEFKKAAFALSSFKFDALRGCTASATQRMTWLVETAEFWLEAGESGSATQSLNKAHTMVKEVKDNVPLRLRFDTLNARVKDSERKFLEASQLYHKLSMQVDAGISKSDLMTTLEHSVSCALLAPADSRRARQLATLYSDERTKDVENFPLLEKMFKEEIVRAVDYEKFDKMLSVPGQEHKRAMTATGLTVLQNSIIEHNLFAASKIYNNVRFDLLGSLLGISAKEAEKIASKMIEQGQISGSIDQIENIIEFTEAESGSATLTAWDGQIQELCIMVNRVLEHIAKKHPQYKAMY